MQTPRDKPHLRRYAEGWSCYYHDCAVAARTPYMACIGVLQENAKKHHLRPIVIFKGEEYFKS